MIRDYDPAEGDLCQGVPLECDTPHEAVAWSYGRPAVRHKEAVRT